MKITIRKIIAEIISIIIFTVIAYMIRENIYIFIIIISLLILMILNLRYDFKIRKQQRKSDK